MLTRLVTGFVLATGIVWLTFTGPMAGVVAVVVAVVGLGAAELLRMFPVVEPPTRLVASTSAAGAAAAMAHSPAAAVATLGLGACAVLSLSLRRSDDLPSAAQQAAIGGLALAYVGVFGACVSALLFMPGPVTDATWVADTFGPISYGRGAFMTLLVVVLLGDTLAYFSGRFLGRHKLAPRVSPKKTVEGAVGGLVASAAGGYLAHVLLLPGESPALMVGAGALCGALGQLGDLTESLFKRASGTKDSGTLLPGHGGVLDRVDGVIFAAPALYAALRLLGAAA